MTIKGFFDDLSDEKTFKYFNFDKPWWPDRLINDVRVNNSVYAVTGDVTPTYTENMSVVHVNTDILKEYNIDIYELVRNKEWTYDKLEELFLGLPEKNVTVYDKRYTLTMASNVAFDDIFYSAGFKYVENLDDVSVKLYELESDKKFLGFVDCAYGLLNNNYDVAILAIDAKADMYAKTGNGFALGNVAFNIGNIAQIKKSLSNVNFKLGIVPMPMYKTTGFSEQDDYYGVHNFWVTLYSVQDMSDAKEMASYFLEKLGKYSYENLTEVYYDSAFTGNANTSENAEMFDLIREGAVFDTACIFSTHIGIFSSFREAATNKSWVDYYLANSGKWNEAVVQINNKLGW